MAGFLLTFFLRRAIEGTGQEESWPLLFFHYWSLKMDSSTSSHSLFDLALGSYTVDLEKMTPKERFRLVRKIIERCQPLKYFPDFRAVSELVNMKHKGFTSETPQGVLTVEVPLGRVFVLTPLSRKSSPIGEHDEGFIIDRESFLVDDTGKFVSWTERTKRTEGLIGMREVAEFSRFALLSDQAVEDILAHASVVLSLVKNLVRAVQEDAPRRFERMQRLERTDAFLQTLNERITVGNPHDPDDDLPF